MPVHPVMWSFWHGRCVFLCWHVCPSVCVFVHMCVWMLWELRCDRDECDVHVSLPTRWQGLVSAEGQTLSSNDRPALNVCVCVFVHAVYVSPREQEERDRESQDKFYFYLFIFPYKRLCVLIDGPFVCMCVQVFYVHGRACVCVLPSLWWGVYMINTRQAWEEFWSGALQQLLWKQH